MSYKKETIDLIRKLETSFPKSELIAIRQHFDKFPHNKSVNISYEVYIEGVGHTLDLIGLQGVEDYIERMIKFHQEV